jgi:hypothetical protein
VDYMLRDKQRSGIALRASRYVRAEALTFHRGASRRRFVAGLNPRPSTGALRASLISQARLAVDLGALLVCQG